MRGWVAYKGNEQKREGGRREGGKEGEGKLSEVRARTEASKVKKSEGKDSVCLGDEDEKGKRGLRRRKIAQAQAKGKKKIG